MLTSLMNAEMAASRRLDLIAAADAARLARQARGARRTEHLVTMALRRTWPRATQPQPTHI